MGWIRIISLLGLLAICLPAQAMAQAEEDQFDSMVRFFSPELRRIEKRLVEIEDKTRFLPDVKDRPWGSRYGHRSADLPDQTTPDWLQIDLGEKTTIDIVVLAPTNLSNRNQDAAGYGFPKRFRIEVSDKPDMSDAMVVVDCSKADVPNPGKYPLFFKIKPAAGRYLRLTSLKHDSDKGVYFWAIEELMAINPHGMMIRTGLKSNQSSYMDLYPFWAPVRAFDGQSALGMPVDVTQSSPTQGYMSAKLSMSVAKDLLSEAHMKWVRIDLGQPDVIEQIRLCPLESDEYEVVGGRGFPRQLKLQLSNDPDFKEILWEDGRGTYTLGYPDGCSVNVPVPKVSARYVRAIATNMWSRDDWLVFGLSEIQICNSQRNLALGKKVDAKDVADKPADAWSPEYLVDGYTSRYRLIEWPEYLEKIRERGILEAEKTQLKKRQVTMLKLGKKIIAGAGVMTLLIAITGWIWILTRQRMVRKREVEQMRQQIARDLHDDIGSNLGGIVLLSEIGSQHSTDAESRHDFEAIRKAADEASTSMRDIVWLIQEDKVGLKDFITKMRQSLRMILKHLDVPVEVEPETYKDRALSLPFRRHVFLSFKEIINNVRKHAQADAVTVKIEIKPDRFRFIVRDEGVGFDLETSQTSGFGMNNLKRRASRLSGSIQINSAPGKGTEVIFEAPFSN